MGEYHAPSASPPHERQHSSISGIGSDNKHDSGPFYSQLEDLTMPGQRQALPSAQYRDADFHTDNRPVFDLSVMTGALSQSGRSSHELRSRQYPQADSAFPVSPASVYQMQQPVQFAPQIVAQYSGPQHAMNRSPSQPVYPPSFPAQHAQILSFHPLMLQTQMPNQYSPVDPRVFATSAQAYGSSEFAPAFPPSMPFRRGPSDVSPIPSFPRGPPRKPKQSGHALWVGNLPPATNVMDLKDHFSREASRDIESVFLISKSNCAFVNYRSEPACAAAMNRFHDSRFHGVRLVCRLRRGSTTTSAPPTPIGQKDSPSSSNVGLQASGTILEQPSSPVIVTGSQPKQQTESSDATLVPPTEARKVPEKFYIIKSLTLQDLEASVRNGIWATQAHNEEILNKAFENAEVVYLIFSANKSGEYFGYARMQSQIAGNPTSPSKGPETSPSRSTNISAQRNETATSSDGPRSILTAATEYAPRGHIIDDSARGTIFWEAEQSVEEEEQRALVTKLQVDGADEGDKQDWGRPFKIQWMSTAKLPFYRTRGLRNPWNANREVKIARDGTELEPEVGKRLVQMFHRPGPQPGEYVDISQRRRY